jgi:nucleoside-diphosphate-sugar epimerase
MKVLIIGANGKVPGLAHEALDCTDIGALTEIVQRHAVTHVYHLAAALSARGEKHPMWAWDLNMKGLLNVLEVARSHKLQRIFWPSSIAAFGPSTPQEHTPQKTVMDPSTVYGISKLAGEGWCAWYHRHHGIDVRSVRYPGLISWKTPPRSASASPASRWTACPISASPSPRAGRARSTTARRSAIGAGAHATT